MDYIKEAMVDVTNIKTKFYGLRKEIELKRDELKTDLGKLRDRSLHIFSCKDSIQLIYIKLILLFIF